MERFLARPEKNISLAFPSASYRPVPIIVSNQNNFCLQYLLALTPGSPNNLLEMLEYAIYWLRLQSLTPRLMPHRIFFIQSEIIELASPQVEQLGIP